MSIDPEKINALLHEDQPSHYKVKVGEEFKIQLPKLPLTGETEFLQLDVEKKDSDCVIERSPEDRGEGHLQPAEIQGIGVKPGNKHYSVKVINVLTQQEIENIDPLEIDLEVEE